MMDQLRLASRRHRGEDYWVGFDNRSALDCIVRYCQPEYGSACLLLRTNNSAPFVLHRPIRILACAARGKWLQFRVVYFPGQLFVAFSDTLKRLPGVSHLAALQLLDANGAIAATIENKPGQSGSLAVYNYLAIQYAVITPEAAAKGLELYAEHPADALSNPGKHPNVDRLIALRDSGQTLRVKHVYADPVAKD
jgi:hypothetical protein